MVGAGAASLFNSSHVTTLNAATTASPIAIQSNVGFTHPIITSSETTASSNAASAVKSGDTSVCDCRAQFHRRGF